jgi:pimeloyl-ACP methyl ester carboxylesterase
VYLDETLAPVRVRLSVTTPLAGPTDVVGLLWVPPGGADTVIVCVHGSGGSKENWGPISAPGYSFAHRMTASGRAVLAIDLPGYGETRARSDQQSMEDFASAVDQVARTVRAGRYVAEGAPPRTFSHVVGNGLSIGALIVEIAQGAYGSFDGIIAAGWSEGGFSEAYKKCLYHLDCPPDPLSEVWLVTNVEPAVTEYLRSRAPNHLSPSGRTSAHLWGGLVFVPGPHGGTGEGAPLPSDAPQLETLTRKIDRPVLLLFGAEDFTWDMAKVPEERARFAASTSVRLELVAKTGHFVRWHQTNDDADRLVLAWLKANGM